MRKLMSQFEQHPTVKRFREQEATREESVTTLDADWLRQLCLEAGADDVGFVELERMAIATSNGTF